MNVHSLEQSRRDMPLLSKVALIVLPIVMLLGACSRVENAVPEPMNTASPDASASPADADSPGPDDKSDEGQAGVALPPNVDIIESCYRLDNCREYQLLPKKAVRRGEQRLVRESLPARSFVVFKV